MLEAQTSKRLSESNTRDQLRQRFLRVLRFLKTHACRFKRGLKIRESFCRSRFDRLADSRSTR